MSQLLSGRNQENEKSEEISSSGREKEQRSFRDFTQKPVEEFQDKENIEFESNRDATFNPYKRSYNVGNSRGEYRKELESLDLNIKDLEKSKYETIERNNKSAMIHHYDSPNRSAIISDNPKEANTISKQELEEDDEVRQMLKEAGMTFNNQDEKILKSKTEEKKISNGRREDSIGSNKLQGAVNQQNDSSLCLYGSESERKINSSFFKGYQNNDYSNIVKHPLIGKNGAKNVTDLNRLRQQRLSPKTSHKLHSVNKLDLSNIQDNEEGNMSNHELKLEKIGETEREYCSPNENTLEESKQVNSILRQSHFKNIDESSLQETKEMVNQSLKPDV